MKFDFDKKILTKAIKLQSIQKVVAIEELSELQKEICKDMRGQLNIAHLIEEMADVYIMLEQLKLMFKVDEAEIQCDINIKLNRLKERMKGGKEWSSIR